MSNEHEQPVENLMKNTMENLYKMVDADTVVGDSVETKDGSTIIPISKMSFGFVSGGSEFSADAQPISNSSFPFGGGSGAGVSVKPVAFLVIKNNTIRLLKLDDNSSADKIIDSIPQILDTVKNFICDLKKNTDKNEENNNTENNTFTTDTF
ncbi:GerW family sporulation protein [Clostridium sp. BJN0001]|uniref:GerW family sporulation protein n=1 Tax=Clostridium sp. BJN0001 TaxID=2930219 RepID=UPI001FD3C89D|nr:GerW family sporulation protein [Clostridium sp. BJN0001]